MSSSNDLLIKQGHQAIRLGNKEEARQLLQEAARQNPNDYRAWLGLAAVAHSPRESLALIEKAAELEPNKPTIQQARKWAVGQIVKDAKAQAEAERIEAALPVSPPVSETPLQERLNQAPKSRPAPEPIEVLAVRREEKKRFLTLRRVVGAAALLGILFALGIVGWFAYTTWWNHSSPTGVITADPGSTPTSAEIVSLPETSASAAPPTQEPTATATPQATTTPNPIQPKNIIQEAGEPRLRWTLTPEPTLTPTPSPTWVPTFVSPISDANIVKPVGLLPSERWIDVTLSTQTLVAYEGDTPVFNTLISSGLPGHETVIGQFRIWLRYPSQTMDGTRLGYDYYLEGVPYVQYFYEDYALHGTYWHSNFGHPMSHGCVNLSTPDAEWLYNFADYGTIVNVHQ
ncbi:MAG: L,D-transpeptidase family protein [Candidatus Promineifilaceae bacterium]